MQGAGMLDFLETPQGCSQHCECKLRRSELAEDMPSRYLAPAGIPVKCYNYSAGILVDEGAERRGGGGKAQIPSHHPLQETAGVWLLTPDQAKTACSCCQQLGWGVLFLWAILHNTQY